MHHELLKTIARVYVDTERARRRLSPIGGKHIPYVPFPSMESLGWVGVDHTRLMWLRKNGYLFECVVDGEMRLQTTEKGRDSLYLENLDLDNFHVATTCDSCDGDRTSSELVDHDEDRWECVDCRDTLEVSLYVTCEFIEGYGMCPVEAE